jgi:release factor glutamine methyltransferase
MRNIVKYIVAHTYRPLLIKYLSETTVWSHKGIVLEIPPGVFHPRFFYSTRLLLNSVARLPLKNSSFLELGAGSGLISFYAEKKGAYVTATDINPLAIEFLYKNEQRNNAVLRILDSDLFTSIPDQKFDYIIINPPYYKKNASTPAEHAWYCGEEGEYFKTLFASLKNYMHMRTIVLMSLCDGCDMDMIGHFAGSNTFRLHCIKEKQTLIEKNFIYQVKSITDEYRPKK